jgi:hypothetical protein
MIDRRLILLPTPMMRPPITVAGSALRSASFAASAADESVVSALVLEAAPVESNPAEFVWRSSPFCRGVCGPPGPFGEFGELALLEFELPKTCPAA